MKRTFGILYAATALCAVIGAALFSGCGDPPGEHHSYGPETPEAKAFQAHIDSVLAMAKVEESQHKLTETQCQTVPGLCASEGVPCFASDVPGPYDVMFLHTSQGDPYALRCRRLNVIAVRVQILPNMAAFGAASDNTISWVKMGVRTRLAMAQGINRGGTAQWNPDTDFCQINNPPSEWTRVMAEKVQGIWQPAQTCQAGAFTSIIDGVSSLVAWTP